MYSTHYFTIVAVLASLTLSQIVQAEPVQVEPVQVEPAHDELTTQHKREQLTLEAKQKVLAFSQRLKQTLVATIKSEGYSAAVEVCKSEAPKIAGELSTDGWTVARTSARVRNPANTPDAWEASELSDFDIRFKAGESADRLSSSTMVGDHYRFMKAIPTAPVCLACHGESIDAGLLKTIKTNYPSDHATGFTLQDIRGAFTLSKALENQPKE